LVASRNEINLGLFKLLGRHREPSFKLEENRAWRA